MPKKLTTNTKSVEARARKEEKKTVEREQKAKAAEDLLWREDDKQVARKESRKEEKDKKMQEQQEKKALLKTLYEEEMSKTKPKSSNNPAPKLTRAQISANAQAKSGIKSESKEKPIEENFNRLVVTEDSARSVHEAISMLSEKGTTFDRHPERRMKAAFTAFEELNLPRLKSENSNMRLSQIKQLLKKEWLKSPDNPMNQIHSAYNSKK